MNLIVRDISNILLKGVWNTTMLLLLYVSTLLTACNGDSDNEDNPPYPSLITEFVDIPTDEYGRAHTIVNDDHTIFQLSNPIDGLQVSATYRAVCGYEITDWDKRIITLYTIEAVDILKAKDTPKCDAIKVTAIWKGGDYLNMNLTPKTQGRKQEWGYHIEYNQQTRLQHLLHFVVPRPKGRPSVVLGHSLRLCLSTSSHGHPTI